MAGRLLFFLLYIYIYSFTSPSRADLDEDHAARMLMGPVRDADSNPTTNNNNPTTTTLSNNNNSKLLVPLGLVINNNPVVEDFLASINTPIPETTKVLLCCSSTPQQLA